MSAAAAPAEAQAQVPPEEPQSIRGVVHDRIEAIRAGDVGSLPVLIGIVAITIFFTAKSSFFFTAVNFTNLIGQMAGVTVIAIGVVFVLLIGEIDLSIAYLGAVAAVIMAELQMPGSGHDCRASSRSRRGSRWAWGSGRCRGRSSRSSACRPSSSRSRACWPGRGWS